MGKKVWESNVIQLVYKSILSLSKLSFSELEAFMPSEKDPFPLHCPSSSKTIPHS